MKILRNSTQLAEDNIPQYIRDMLFYLFETYSEGRVSLSFELRHNDSGDNQTIHICDINKDISFSSDNPLTAIVTIKKELELWVLSMS